MSVIRYVKLLFDNEFEWLKVFKTSVLSTSFLSYSILSLYLYFVLVRTNWHIRQLNVLFFLFKIAEILENKYKRWLFLIVDLLKRHENNCKDILDMYTTNVDL